MTANVGRRAVLGGIGAGVLAIVSGGRFLPRIQLPRSGGGWRIYNVAGSMPSTGGFALRVDGMVRRPLSLDRDAVLALPHHEEVEDFECVTGWRVGGVRWSGVRVDDLLDQAGADHRATHLTFHSRDGVYSDSLRLADATSNGTLLVTGMDGAPLPRQHGGPVRLVVPAMYGYKSVKWVGRVEVVDHETTGYWERRGYARDARIHGRREAAVYLGRTAAVPGIPYAVSVPAGWSVRPLAVGGAVLSAPTPGQRVEASVTASTRVTPVHRADAQALLAELERAGLASTRYGVIRAGSLTADTMTAIDGSGQRFLFAFVADHHRLVQVQCQAPDVRWSTWEPWFGELVASLRPVS